MSGSITQQSDEQRNCHAPRAAYRFCDCLVYGGCGSEGTPADHAVKTILVGNKFRRHFPADAKLKAVQSVLIHGRDVGDVATEVGLSPKAFKLWIKAYQERGDRAFVGKGSPKSADEYHALARKTGFRWLGESVISAATPTEWHCEAEHVWLAPYSRIKQGHGCPQCQTRSQAERQRLPASAYVELGLLRDFEWSGPRPMRVKDVTGWACRAGHTWAACYSNVRNGSGCPHCAGLANKTEEDYLELAHEKGITWLGPLPLNSKEETNWQCPSGHQWQSSFTGVRKALGSGCLWCAGKARISDEEYIELANGRGIEWLGPSVSTTHDPTTWRCMAGHPSWVTSYKAIRRGTGCPHCAARAPKTEDDYRELAIARGFVWLGPMVSSTKLPTTWQCPKGHTWLARYNNVSSGRTGCPNCEDLVNGKLVSANQRLIADMVCGELNRQIGPYWIDIAIEQGDTTIAIEYDAWYWHADSRDADADRDAALQELGIKVLRIKSNRLVPTQSEIEHALETLNSGSAAEEIVLTDWGHGPTRSGR